MWPVIYEIDEEDKIARVNEEWSTFAQSNSGAHLLPPGVCGQTLWDHIHDAPTRQLYRTMFSRIRSGVPAMTFDFRCDSPDARRLLRMSMSQLHQGSVLFSVTAASIIQREPFEAKTASVEDDVILITMCSWCKRIPDQYGDWQEVEDAVRTLGLFQRDVFPPVTHGICEECNEKLLTYLDDPGEAAEGAVVLGGAPFGRD